MVKRKEEAIEYFKFQRKIFCEDHLKICPKGSIAYQVTLKEKEFYDMAIKALEQMPCEDTTNGKVLLKMFPPSVYYGDDEKHIVLLTKDCELTCYNNEWWNAPYERRTDETDN